MARADGLRVRMTAIRGQTPRHLLRIPLLFPAALNDVALSEEADHREITTIGAGQFSLGAPGRDSKQLATVDLETLTIEWDPKWLVQNGVDPLRLRAELYGILRWRKPVHLTARVMRGSSAPYELNMAATLRSVERTLKGAEVDTRYYTVRIAEWRRLAMDSRATTPQGRAKGVKLPAKHKLAAGDTLTSLSRHYYGSAAGWQAIAKTNGIRGWGQNTALVKTRRYKVGSVLRIPVKPPLASVPRRKRK